MDEMNLTKMKRLEIIKYSKNFDRAQSLGLNSLIFLALREQTSVAHQYEECGFQDIPEELIAGCDALENDELLDLAGEITFHLLGEKITAAVEDENAQYLAAQAIHDQNQPTLLSDY
ncbi:MAG: hypothetical protein V7K98_12390 [Nostoc sp.]|uniref:hypothetical protein n=1 Tax=Nostoc sp. TaxID=1180 RepID=UPI002FF9056A